MNKFIHEWSWFNVSQCAHWNLLCSLFYSSFVRVFVIIAVIVIWVFQQWHPENNIIYLMYRKWKIWNACYYYYHDNSNTNYSITIIIFSFFALFWIMYSEQNGANVIWKMVVIHINRHIATTIYINTTGKQMHIQTFKNENVASSVMRKC